MPYRTFLSKSSKHSVVLKPGVVYELVSILWTFTFYTGKNNDVFPFEELFQLMCNTEVKCSVIWEEGAFEYLEEKEGLKFHILQSYFQSLREKVTTLSFAFLLRIVKSTAWEVFALKD